METMLDRSNAAIGIALIYVMSIGLGVAVLQFAVWLKGEWLKGGKK